MQTLDIGEIAPLTTTWWQPDGTPANPGTITLRITKPDGTTVVKAKGDMAQGVTDDIWIYSQLIDQAGVWRVAVSGSIGSSSVTQPEQVFLAGIATNDGGPCEPWCTWADVEACATPPSLDAPGRELVLDQATEVLFNLTGRKYPGLCSATRSLCFACGSCYPTACDCAPYPSLDLSGRYPVWSAFDVTIDGVLLDSAAYAVRDRRWLVRLDGQVWPTGWNVADPAQFRVSWVYGRPVPTGGRAAAAQFALEIAKLCAGDKTCTLPQRVTNISREGISYTILDPMTMIQEGRTGLPMVDLWIASDTIGSKPPARIYHPSLGASERIR